MPKSTKEFLFDIGDPVIIKEVQRPGRIELIQCDYLGTQYRVAYWDNSDRRSVWLYGDELQLRQSA